MHLERSTFTIGFRRGAVARERLAGRAQAGEQPRLSAPDPWERGAHLRARTRTHAHAGREFEPRRPQPPEGAPRRRSRQSRASRLASRPLIPAAVAWRKEEPGTSASVPAARALRRAARWTRRRARCGSAPLASELSELAAPRPGFRLSAPHALAAPAAAAHARARSRARRAARGGARAPELLSRPLSRGKSGCPPEEAHRRAVSRTLCGPSVSPWRLISNPGSRLTWRRTRSVPCLR